MRTFTPLALMASLLVFAGCPGNVSPGGGTPGTATPLCGNGKVDLGELCDPCPTSCDDGVACTRDFLEGSGCRAQCNVARITTCTSTTDGCCPDNCNSTSDQDCSQSCGDGIVDEGETCDGDCMNCMAPDACTTVSQFGTASNCNIECQLTSTAMCGAADGCCPRGCMRPQDGDCPDLPMDCGNGTIDPGELCDGNCPTDCPSAMCLTGELLGSAMTCTATCTFSLITMCADGDSCCPSGCTGMDMDCAAPAGIGGPCADQVACAATLMNAAATCLPAPTFPDGYCTTQCASNTDCPSGAFCQIELNICMPTCDMAEPDCRAGYSCQMTADVLENAANACFPIPN